MINKSAKSGISLKMNKDSIYSYQKFKIICKNVDFECWYMIELKQGFSTNFYGEP